MPREAGRRGWGLEGLGFGVVEGLGLVGFFMLV